MTIVTWLSPVCSPSTRHTSVCPTSPPPTSPTPPPSATTSWRSPGTRWRLSLRGKSSLTWRNQKTFRTNWRHSKVISRTWNVMIKLLSWIKSTGERKVYRQFWLRFVFQAATTSGRQQILHHPEGSCKSWWHLVILYYFRWREAPRPQGSPSSRNCSIKLIDQSNCYINKFIHVKYFSILWCINWTIQYNFSN